MNPALAPPPLLPLNRFPPTSNKSALDPLIHYSLKTKGRAKRKKKTSEVVHRRAHLHFIMAPTKLDSSNLVTKTKGRIYDITDNKIHAGGDLSFGKRRTPTCRLILRRAEIRIGKRVSKLKSSSPPLLFVSLKLVMLFQ